MPVRPNGGVITFPLPTFALVMRWRGGLGLAGVYSGEYVDRSYCTICSAATYASCAPLDDVPACFITTFLGERTPVVGCVGLRVREHTRAFDTGPWPVGGDGENAAISTGSKIRTLLDEALVWFDLEGALGVGVSMASDLGVLGEVCEAMMVILEKRMEFGMETGGWL